MNRLKKILKKTLITVAILAGFLVVSVYWMSKDMEKTLENSRLADKMLASDSICFVADKWASMVMAYCPTSMPTPKIISFMLGVAKKETDNDFTHLVSIHVFNSKARMPRNILEFNALGTKGMHEVKVAHHFYNKVNRSHETFCKKGDSKELVKCDDTAKTVTADNNIVESRAALTNEMAGEDKAGRERDLLSSLQQVEKKDNASYFQIYFQLSEIDPANKKYAKKKDEYLLLLKKDQDAVSKKLAKDREAVAKKLTIYGEAPKRGGFDGNFRVIREYLKSVANDPDSIELKQCTDPVFQDGKGYIIACSYFGKNAFGAKVQNHSFFTVRNGQAFPGK